MRKSRGMNGASAEYVIITEPSFDAPRLTTMLVQARETVRPKSTIATVAAHAKRGNESFFMAAIEIQNNRRDISR